MAMSTRFAAPEKRTRRWLASATAAAIVTLSVPFIGIAPANAALGDTFGPFEIDGDAVSQTMTDWKSLAATGVVTVNDNTVGNQDNTTFNSSSKEYDAPNSQNGWPNWKYGAANNAADKTDFGRVALYDTKDNQDKQWVYVGFDRGSATGTGKFAVELNQVRKADLNANPIRSEGDVRFIVWDQGNGSITLVGDASNPDVGAYKWDIPGTSVQGTVDTNRTGNWVKFSDAAAAANFKGAVNSASVSVPTWWTGNNVVNGNVGSDQFVEFGFNLSGLGAVLGCPSQGFAAWNMRSLTGTGQTGALKDYIAEQGIDIPSTCATMTFIKTSPTGTVLPGTEITITPNPTTGTGSLTVTTGADGSVTVTSVKPGDYTFAETKAPLGYILVPWTQNVTITAGEAYTYTFVNPLGDIQWTKAYEGYTAQSIPQGFVGQKFTVTRSDDAVDMTNAQFATISGITATGCPTACTFDVVDNGTLDADSTWGEIRVNKLPVGTYSIKETVGGQPVGFGPDNGTGTAIVPTSLPVADLVDGKVINHLVTATRSGNPATTFTNPRLAGQLIVKKLGTDTNGVGVAGATFTLWKVVGLPDSTSAETNDVDLGSFTTEAPNGTKLASGLAWGSTYYFEETAAPAPYNLPDNRYTNTYEITAAVATAQAAGGSIHQLSVTDPKSTISTSATVSAALPNAGISDTATLGGIRGDAGGTITFTVYGPFATNASATCTSKAHVLAPVDVSGPGTYSSPTYTATEAGRYFWIASYSGDANTGTKPIAGLCGDTGETSLVTPAAPGITTVAKSTARGGATLPVNSGIYDTAKIYDISAPITGNVTFRVYLPGDTTCEVAAPTRTFVVDVSTATVVTDANDKKYIEVTSPTYNASAAGTYRWVASYGGDANNVAVSGACNDAGENIPVEKASPTIETTATPSAQLPVGTISDSATLKLLTADAAGNVTFSLYKAPAGLSGTEVCVAGNAVAGYTSVVAFGPGTAYTVVAGQVTVPSAAYTPTTAGTYYWVASYNGDANNKAVAGVCGDLKEISTVTPAAPAIVTTATDGAFTAGASTVTITDTAVISGLAKDATGEVTFLVYGPYASQAAAELCPAGAALVTTKVVTLTGTNAAGGSKTVSASVEVTTKGYYAWKATYSGDANNLTATHDCGEQTGMDEISQVTPTEPAIVTFATPTATLGITEGSSVKISDSATVSGLTKTASGNVTFELYGPDDATCETKPSTSNAGSIAGKVSDLGAVTLGSGDFTVTMAGTYRWIARYAGDVNNPGVSGACNDANEITVVTQGKPGISKIVESPAGTAVTGSVAVGTVLHYTVTVTNDGDASITDTVTDVLPAGLGAPTSISNGGSYSSGTRTITWTAVTLAGGAQLELTYNAAVLASAAADGKDTLINDASWFNLRATTTTKVKWLGLSVTPICAVEGSKAVEVGYSLTSHNFTYLGSTGPFGVSLAWSNGSPVNPATVDGSPQGMGSFVLADGAAVTGTLYYPGTTVTGGQATDWPGWKYDALTNTWTQENDGLLPSVTLSAASNAVSTSALVVYDQNAACNPPGIPLLDKSSPTQQGSVENPSGEVLPGATVDYSVKITNNGGQTVTSDLVDTLPAGVTPVVGSYSVAPSSVVGQTITWTNVSLAAGESKTFTFKVTVDGGVAAGQLVNTATWAGMSDTTVHVVTPAVPGLDKSSPTEVGSELNPSGNVAGGSKIHYVITLSNTGGATVVSDLIDTLPAGVTPVDGTFTPNAPDSVNGQTLTWERVAVKGGETVTYEFDVTVDAAAGPGEIVDLFNDATWNELEDRTQHIVVGPGVEITPTLDKSSDPVEGSTVKIGDVITYTVKVGNDGNVAITGDLVDTLPAGIKVVGDYTRSDGGTAAPDSATSTKLVWNAVTVQPGDVVTFTYKVEVLDTAKDLDTLLNTATWLTLEDSTSHTVTVPQPPLPQTGLGTNPLTSLLWASLLVGLGIGFLVLGRTRRETEES